MARDQKVISFATCRANCQRWTKFSRWAMSEGIKRMEDITPSLIERYARFLELDGLSTSTVQNAVACVNSTLKIASGGLWDSVRAVQDLGVERRSYVRTAPPADDDELAALLEKLNPRQAALVRLCRAFGLREREASLLDCKRALSEAVKNRSVSITLGTKGGQPRKVPVLNQYQINVLEAAVLVQGNGRSIIPKDLNWIQFRNTTIRKIQYQAAKLGIKGIHTFRAAYACQRYRDLSGEEAPCIAKERKADRDTDKDTRMTISEELGHHRLNVLVCYVGSRK
jgi:site-specific recombinase XerC